MKRLLTAVAEYIELRAERHRETIAARFLNCRCGCAALNGLDDA